MASAISRSVSVTAPPRVSRNAPSTSRTGAELAASVQLTPHVSASASATVINAQYTQTFKSGTTTVNAGNQIPGIPATSLFSELAWSSNDTPAHKGAPAMGTRLGLELVQAGRLYANDTNTESADGHTVLNLAASQRFSHVFGGSYANHTLALLAAPPVTQNKRVDKDTATARSKSILEKVQRLDELLRFGGEFANAMPRRSVAKRG